MSGVAGALGVAGLVSNIWSNTIGQDNFREQMNFSKLQYQDMKRYNSAQEQVHRLRAAGINPALAFGQNAGQVSAVSQPAPTPPTPLDMNGLSSIAQGITLNDAQVRNIESQTKKNQEEAQGLNIDNLFKHEDWLSKIYNRDTESWLRDQLAQSAKLAVQFDKESLKDRLWEQKMRSQLLQAQAYAQFYVNEYIPAQQQAEVDNLVASAAVAYMQGRASLQQAHASIMNAESTKKAFDAQYGGNPLQRSKFFKASLEYLEQQKRTAESQEFSNYGFEDKVTPYSSKHRAQYNPHSKKWEVQRASGTNSWNHWFRD